MEGFPGGPVVKNPPPNARAMGSIPDLGRFHMPQGSWACALQPLNLCAAATEACAPWSLSSAAREATSSREETDLTLQLKSGPCLLQAEKVHTQQQSTRAAKNK